MPCGKQIIEQVFDSTPGFLRTVTTIIAHNGHLITNPIIHFDLPRELEKYVKLAPHKLIQRIEINVNGNRINKILNYTFPFYWKLYKLQPYYSTNGDSFTVSLPIPFDTMIGKNAMILLKHHNVNIRTQFSGVDDLFDNRCVNSRIAIKLNNCYMNNCYMTIDSITLSKDDTLYLKYQDIWENEENEIQPLPFPNVIVNKLEYECIYINARDRSVSGQMDFILPSMGLIVYFRDPKISFERINIKLDGIDFYSTEYNTCKILNWKYFYVDPPEGNYYLIPFCNSKIQNSSAYDDNFGKAKITINVEGIDFNDDHEYYDYSCIYIFSLAKVTTNYIVELFPDFWDLQPAPEISIEDQYPIVSNLRQLLSEKDNICKTQIDIITKVNERVINEKDKIINEQDTIINDIEGQVSRIKHENETLKANEYERINQDLVQEERKKFIKQISEYNDSIQMTMKNYKKELAIYSKSSGLFRFKKRPPKLPLLPNLVIPSETISALELAAQDVCVICLEEKKIILFQPCNHLVLCQTCSDTYTYNTCPTCRTKVKTRTKVYC